MSTATLTWTPPSIRTDGTALAPTDIAGADIYDSMSSSTTPIGSVVGAVGTFTTGLLAVGTHVFTVITRDTTGHSSAASNPVSDTIQPTLAAPSAITDLTVVINP